MNQSTLADNHPTVNGRRGRASRVIGAGSGGFKRPRGAGGGEQRVGSDGKARAGLARVSATRAGGRGDGGEGSRSGAVSPRLRRAVAL